MAFPPQRREAAWICSEAVGCTRLSQARWWLGDSRTRKGARPTRTWPWALWDAESLLWILPVATIFFHGRTSYSSTSKREIKPKTQPQRKTNGKSWIFCLISKLLLNHLQDVVGGTVAPARREADVLTPGIVHMNVTFFGKKDFADTIKLRIPRQNPPGLIG